jgi:hypothetical protein
MHLATSDFYPIPSRTGDGLTPQGVSDEAEVLRKNLAEVHLQLDAVTQFVAEMRQAIGAHIRAEIDRILAECTEDGWSEEEGSTAIHRASGDKAKAFVAMIDVSLFPVPEVIPEPDGDLALEWHRDNARWVLASFQPDGQVNYACRTGDGCRATGTCRITQEFARIVEGYLTIVYAG